MIVLYIKRIIYKKKILIFLPVAISRSNSYGAIFKYLLRSTYRTTQAFKVFRTTPNYEARPTVEYVITNLLQ
jgi:hypothetical protein